MSPRSKLPPVLQVPAPLVAAANDDEVAVLKVDEQSQTPPILPLPAPLIASSNDDEVAVLQIEEQSQLPPVLALPRPAVAQPNDDDVPAVELEDDSQLPPVLQLPPPRVAASNEDDEAVLRIEDDSQLPPIIPLRPPLIAASTNDEPAVLEIEDDSQLPPVLPLAAPAPAATTRDEISTLTPLQVLWFPRPSYIVVSSDDDAPSSGLEDEPTLIPTPRTLASATAITNEDELARRRPPPPPTPTPNGSTTWAAGGGGSGWGCDNHLIVCRELREYLAEEGQDRRVRMARRPKPRTRNTRFATSSYERVKTRKRNPVALGTTTRAPARPRTLMQLLGLASRRIRLAQRRNGRMVADVLVPAVAGFVANKVVTNAVAARVKRPWARPVTSTAMVVVTYYATRKKRYGVAATTGSAIALLDTVLTMLGR